MDVGGVGPSNSEHKPNPGNQQFEDQVWENKHISLASTG